MSIRRLNKIAFQVVLELAQRLKNVNVVENFGKVGLKILKQNRLTFRRTIFRGFRIIARQPNQLWRPFSSLHFRQHHLNQTRNGLFFFRDNRDKKDVLHTVRQLFGTNVRYNNSLNSTEMPENLDGYEIGNFIASGCNGAVFKLRLKDKSNNRESLQDDNTYKLYPLALKVLFSDDFSTPEYFIWEEMCSELIPLVKLPKTFSKGKFSSIKTLVRSHPNIIKMYTAFTDKISALPEAEKLLINKLQNRRFNLSNYLEMSNNAKTLYVVMKRIRMSKIRPRPITKNIRELGGWKSPQHILIFAPFSNSKQLSLFFRYRMTLQQYLKSYKRNYLQVRIMFGQLMEAIVFLHKNKICHRDMKSDNILLDFDFEEEVPHLVLSDFGSALSNGDWIINCSSDGEFSNLGGIWP
ncbi:Protein kinase domain-containing protein [Meloidogyne graminicola]|uniref:non-specific serine/threonine protein kinase n=1 Tax=Meloidogyne graminicola TaxID=189291 RepID=A0A8T0A3N5_9BILA|nr:Protein kinase domain-containing protein [Meloidogyne graminicola]